MADVSQPSSLNLEPNPFEQSFASNTQQGRTATAAANDPAAAPPAGHGAIQQDPNKRSGQNFAPGATGLGQKTPIPGIDKMLTPLPLAPGAAPFGHTGPLTSQMGVFGATSPAGWLPSRFGPITPGALNTPSLEAFNGHQGHSVQPHIFPHLGPAVEVPQLPDSHHVADANGVPRADLFGRPSQGALPLESPGINHLTGISTSATSSQHMPHMHHATAYNNEPSSTQESGSRRNSNNHAASSGSKPPGESAAANGLYMLSQNQLADKPQNNSLLGQNQAGVEQAVPSPEASSSGGKPHQPAIPQPSQAAQPSTHRPSMGEVSHPGRRSIDSNGSSSVDESVSSGPRAGLSRSRNNSTSGRKRTSTEVEGAENPTKTEIGAEEENGDKRGWTNSQHSSDAENEEKRKQFLERNRIAAIKCRARKKQWVDSLQQKVDMYARANEELIQKGEKARADFEELRQFIVTYHNTAALPPRILHLVQGTSEPANLAHTTPGRDYGLSQHVLPNSIPGAMPAHTSIPPTMQSSISSVPSTAPSMGSSMVGSPSSQRAVPSRVDGRYQPHIPHQGQLPGPAAPQSAYPPPRQQQVPLQQQPQMHHHIHQSSP